MISAYCNNPFGRDRVYIMKASLIIEKARKYSTCLYICTFYVTKEVMYSTVCYSSVLFSVIYYLTNLLD